MRENKQEARDADTSYPAQVPTLAGLANTVNEISSSTWLSVLSFLFVLFKVAQKTMWPREEINEMTVSFGTLAWLTFVEIFGTERPVSPSTYPGS